MTQDQLLRAAGPANRGILKRICDIANDELAPLAGELQDYIWPSSAGFTVPLERGVRCSLDSVREIACSFGDPPRMEEAMLRQHGECLIQFARTIDELKRSNETAARRTDRWMSPTAAARPVERTIVERSSLTPTERALQMRLQQQRTPK